MEKTFRVLLISGRADHGGGPMGLYSIISEDSDVQFYAACPREDPYWSRFTNLLGEDCMCEIPHRTLSLRSIYSLSRFIRHHNIHAIICSGKAGGFYGRVMSALCGIFCFHKYDGIHVGQYNAFECFLYFNVERVLRRFSHHIIAVCDSEKKKMLEHQLAPSSQIFSIANGTCSNVPQATEMGDGDKLRIVTVTRFNYQKNTQLLLVILEYLELMGVLDQFHFTVIGDGEGSNAFRQQLIQKGFLDRVDCLGFVDNPVEVLATHHVYLSTSRWEGFPIAVLEAMAVGLPIVATDIWGHYECVENGVNGYLYSIDDAHAGAKALALLQDRNLWRQYSMHSRQKQSCTFSLDQMRAKYQRLFSAYNQRVNRVVV